MKEYLQLSSSFAILNCTCPFAFWCNPSELRHSICCYWLSVWIFQIIFWVREHCQSTYVNQGTQEPHSVPTPFSCFRIHTNATGHEVSSMRFYIRSVPKLNITIALPPKLNWIPVASNHSLVSSTVLCLKLGSYVFCQEILDEWQTRWNYLDLVDLSWSLSQEDRK